MHHVAEACKRRSFDLASQGNDQQKPREIGGKGILDA